jgi:TRAP-type C4-dicarboxylate transport system substrate-binding protein
LVQPWIAAIADATEGRIKVTSFPTETLLKSDAIYEGIKKGVADLGLSCYAYTRGQFPVMEVFELPGIVYNTSDAASRIAWEGAKALNPKELQDTTHFMIFTTGPGHLFTKKPVRNLGDLKGMEIRATGLSAATLKALGATPVAMPQAEAWESLSKGVVKGNLGPTEILKGWRQAEVTDYITITPFLYNTLFFFTMNTDKWNKISEKDRQAILKINDKFYEEVACGLWDKQNAAAHSYAVDEHKLEVITLSDAEMQKWTGLIQPVLDDFVSKMNNQGFKGREILDSVQALSKKHNK